jgi:hypothetical protein
LSPITPNETQAGTKSVNKLVPTQPPIQIYSSPVSNVEKSDLADEAMHSIEFTKMLRAEQHRIEQKIAASEETQKHQLKRFEIHRSKAKEEMKAAEQVEREMDLERQNENLLRRELKRMQLVGSGDR